MVDQKKKQADENLKSRSRDTAEAKLASLSLKAPKIKTKEL